MQVHGSRGRLILFLVCAVVVSSGVWIYLAKRFPGISGEHGAMETVQVTCLLAGVVILLAGRRGTHEPGLRLLSAAAALLYFTMALLEFDVRPFKIAWLTQLFNGPV